jgi:hypothetical protein
MKKIRFSAGLMAGIVFLFCGFIELTLLHAYAAAGIFILISLGLLRSLYWGRYLALFILWITMFYLLFGLFNPFSAGETFRAGHEDISFMARLWIFLLGEVIVLFLIYRLINEKSAFKNKIL